MKLLSKIKSLFEKENRDGVIVVEREDFAKEMKEKFKGNIELLKAIEEGMNPMKGFPLQIETEKILETICETK